VPDHYFPFLGNRELTAFNLCAELVGCHFVLVGWLVVLIVGVRRSTGITLGIADEMTSIIFALPKNNLRLFF
jgi:hypothetical protein